MNTMKKILALLVTLCLIIGTSGCVGNANLTEGLTNESNTFNYVVVYEAGEYRLHTVSKWSDSDSDAFGVLTSCCNNRFWTSFNVSTLYKDLPGYLPECVIVCGGDLK